MRRPAPLPPSARPAAKRQPAARAPVGTLARDEAMAGPVHDQVYAALRNALIGGRLVPGRGVTLRGLAGELGVSPMPVREAIRRLAAERALDVRANRRVYVPSMTPERCAEILACRLMLEPAAAARALPFIDAARLAAIEAHDEAVETALTGGDVEAYMAANRAFHFAIYTAAPTQVLRPLIESLWLQFGPFMRTVYGRLGTANLVDHHVRAIAAIRARDAAGLADALADDIRAGMALIEDALAQDMVPAAPPRRRPKA
jgi:DNA-binding GntR family transcriptional regulator